MPEGPEKYAAYLCSHEWAVKRSVVRKRSKGQCERCKHGDAKQCHHLTYIRKYKELPEDLLDVCPGCHAWIHDHSKEDPIEYWKSLEPVKPFRILTCQGGELVVQCPTCRGEFDCVHLQQSPPCNGDFVSIYFQCECGENFRWELQFHKGSTYLEIVEGR